MKKDYKTVVGTFALVAIVLTGSQLVANAYQGDYTKQGPNYTEERHQVITQAFENNDYNAWKEQMNGRGRAVDVINQDNFAQFAKARTLGLSGDIAGADAIRAELGLRTHDGNGGGYGKGRGNGEHRGQNRGENFVDANDDGMCDHINS